MSRGRQIGLLATKGFIGLGLWSALGADSAPGGGDKYDWIQTGLWVGGGFVVIVIAIFLLGRALKGSQKDSSGSDDSLL